MQERTVLGGAVAVALALTGCAAGDTTTENAEAVGAAQSAVVGQDTYLYFRCNATGWNVDDATRLLPTADPYVFTLTYDVQQPWMTGTGDQCIFTETNQRDGWGTLQNFYGSVHNTVSVPGGDFIGSQSNFTVKYPSVGRYKVTVNWMQGIYQITPVTLADTWKPCGTNLITTIAQAPQALDNAFVGCSNGDVFLTFNARSTSPSFLKVDSWATSAGTFGIPDSAINAIAYSPADIKTAYLAVAGSKQGHKLWKTGTGGANWVELPSVPLAEIWSISVNPIDTSKVYVAGPGGVAMSTDFGTTWTSAVVPGPLTPPLGAGETLSTVTSQGGNPNTVWVGTTLGNVYRTDNALAGAGQVWVQETHGMPNRMVLRVTAEPNVTYPATYATFDGMYTDSVWITTNNGFGWANLDTPPLPTTPMPLPGIYAFYGVSLNPVDSHFVYIDGTYGAGMSTNAGAVWSWASN